MNRLILNRLLLLTVFLCMAVSLFPESKEVSRNLRFIHLTNDNGLPSNTVYAICQDHKGFIWIGTKSGLCKYDGTSISVYSYEPGVKGSIPHNNIKNIFEDRKHRLWIATHGGVCMYDRNQDTFQAFAKDSLTVYSKVMYEDDAGNIYAGGGFGVCVFNEGKQQFERLKVGSAGEEVRGNVTSITSRKNGELWISTLLGGLICVDIKQGKITRFKHNEGHPFSLISNRILSLFRDSSGKIWIGSADKGICFYDDQEKKFTAIDDFPAICVRSFIEDSEGNIWIGSENGLYIYSPSTGTMTHNKQDYNNKHSLNDNAIYSIIRDKENNLLIGTYFGGINIFPNSFRQFQYYDYGYSNKHLSGKAVRQIIGDKTGNLWIATEDGGLNYYDFSKKTFEHFKPDNTRNSLSYHNVHSLLLDRHNNLWIGTYLGGLNKYDLQTKHFTHYRVADHPGLYVDNIFSMLEDSDGEIWFGTTNGLSVFNPETQQFRAFRPNLFRSQTITSMCMDSDGSIWISTNDRGVYCYNKQMESLQNYSYQPNQPDGKGIPDKFITYIFMDSQQNIWIGTHEGGLCMFDKKTEQFVCYNKKNGLPSNTVFGIIESTPGYLWISTNNGLSCLNIKQKTFVNYSTDEGLPNKQFNYNSAYKDAEGFLYFGTINGMIAFQPEKLQMEENSAKVEFRDFKIFGKSVKPGDKDSPLSKNIEEVDEIHLNSDQARSFTFDFTVPTITHPTNTSYAIKFRGDKDWSYMGNQNHVTYANLPPGEYVLMVKAAFNNKWDKEENIKSIKIIISPPFWGSFPAYIIYILVLLGLIMGLYFFLRNRQREKSLIISERLEKEKIKEINDLKLNFFTNISHELRTPLSLILVPIQSFLDKHLFSSEIYPKMKSVANNALRMNNLVDELMLFTKIETKQEKIRVKKGNLLDFIGNICDGFSVLAEEKGLVYDVQISPSAEDAWFAPAKVEKIAYNLLSNAFKYTDEGRILVEASLIQETDYTFLHLNISDTGVGIAADEMEKIFENYYQVNDYVKSKKSGFGIGLALVRELAILHKGSIHVESELHRGSTFSVRINVSKEAFLQEEISGKDADARFLEDYKFQSVDTENKFPADTAAGEDAGDKPYKILVVEDNIELLNFYREMFSDTYVVCTAEDGERGLAIAESQFPDIIISDVMMPKVNGFDFCRKIKSSIETSHIPFILLTAKTDEEAELEGYDCGADLFIKKPFHPGLIQRQITNLIATRENLKKQYLLNKVELTDVVSNERDKKLILRIEDLIKRNLENDSFSVNDILKELGIGRTLLHVKLKNTVGLSATEFINNIRLKESLRILLAGGNVSEAAYGSGFSSPNYYSRCFKKMFGMSPNEYIGKHK